MVDPVCCCLGTEPQHASFPYLPQNPTKCTFAAVNEKKRVVTIQWPGTSRQRSWIECCNIQWKMAVMMSAGSGSQAHSSGGCSRCRGLLLGGASSLGLLLHWACSATSWAGDAAASSLVHQYLQHCMLVTMQLEVSTQTPTRCINQTMLLLKVYLQGLST